MDADLFPHTLTVGQVLEYNATREGFSYMRERLLVRVLRRTATLIEVQSTTDPSRKWRLKARDAEYLSELTPEIEAWHKRESERGRVQGMILALGRKIDRGEKLSDELVDALGPVLEVWLAEVRRY